MNEAAHRPDERDATPQPSVATGMTTGATTASDATPAPSPEGFWVQARTLRTALSASIVVAGVAACVLFLLETRFALALTFGAAMAAVALDHGVGALERRGVHHGVAIAIVVGGFLAVGAGLVMILVPPIVSQGQALIADAPAMWARARRAPVFVSLDALFGIEEQLRTYAQAPGSAMTAVEAFLRAAGGLVALLFLAIFMLVFGRNLSRTFLDMARPTRRARYERIVGNLYTSIGGYGTGLLAVCSINAVLTTSFLAIIGLPFFLPLGALAGVSSLMPYAGPLVSGTVISILAATKLGMWKGLATAGYFVFYGQLEGNVLAPLIYKRTVHVNPLLTLLAVLFLLELMGSAGAVIAVPAVAAAQIVVREILAARHPKAAEGTR